MNTIPSPQPEHSWLRRTFTTLLNHPIIRFGMVGLVTTTADILVFTGLHRLPVHIVVGNDVDLYTYIAETVGFVTGLTLGYMLNSRFVFAQNRSTTAYLRYAVVSLGGLLWTFLITYLVFDHYHLVSALGAKLISVGLVFFWNYSLSRLWTFRQPTVVVTEE